MWGFDDQAVGQIELTKIDVTMDYKGSFLPRKRYEAYLAIKAILERELGEIFRAPATNFLAPAPLTGLKLRCGGNNLTSCVQYAVHDGDGLKLLQVKIYDKLMDLVGRDGAAIVGSKIAKVVGCQGTLSAFDKRVSRARWVGMTRLELSLCSGALRRYRPFQPSMKTLWSQRVNAAFQHLDRLVLNNEEVLAMSHRRLNIAHFLGELSLSQVQVLAIGHQATWLVNHRTAHRSHFVGTQLRHKDGCSGKLNMKANRIETFVKRFAAADSQIRVYSLMADEPHEHMVAELRKKGSSHNQLPGCHRPGSNGINLPEHLRAPIPATEMGKIWLEEWGKCAWCIAKPGSYWSREAMEKRFSKMLQICPGQLEWEETMNTDKND